MATQKLNFTQSDLNLQITNGLKERLKIPAFLLVDISVKSRFANVTRKENKLDRTKNLRP